MSAAQLKTVDLESGITAAYRQVPERFDSSKPTLILLHTFTTHSCYYAHQLESEALSSRFNLLAIDEIGHGYTKGGHQQWTFWDTAKMALDVMDSLGVKKAFALGSSQGGAIVTQMALLAPEKIAGLVDVGTSMEAETQQTRDLGCWNVPAVEADWYSILDPGHPTPNWVVPDKITNDLMGVGLSEDVPAAFQSYWNAEHKKVYGGENGREKLLQASKCLFKRDSLVPKLGAITCPVLVIHGTKDNVFSIPLVKKWTALLQNAKVQTEIIEGGHHFLSVSHPAEVEKLVISFVEQNVKA